MYILKHLYERKNFLIACIILLMDYKYSHCMTIKQSGHVIGLSLAEATTFRFRKSTKTCYSIGTKVKIAFFTFTSFETNLSVEALQNLSKTLCFEGFVLYATGHLPRFESTLSLFTSFKTNLIVSKVISTMDQTSNVINQSGVWGVCHSGPRIKMNLTTNYKRNSILNDSSCDYSLS